MMVAIGIGLVATAAVVETVVGLLFVTKRLSPNPHMPWAMFSGVVFAVAGTLFYLAA